MRYFKHWKYFWPNCNLYLWMFRNYECHLRKLGHLHCSVMSFFKLSLSDMIMTPSVALSTSTKNKLRRHSFFFHGGMKNYNIQNFCTVFMVLLKHNFDEKSFLIMIQEMPILGANFTKLPEKVVHYIVEWKFWHNGFTFNHFSVDYFWEHFHSFIFIYNTMLYTLRMNDKMTLKKWIN